MNKEEDEIKEALYILTQKIKSKIEKDNSATDSRVSSQKTVWFKFWCWLNYRHLFISNVDNKKMCIRCGHEIQIKSK